MKALVVDDSKSVRMVLQMLLEQLGYGVDCAENGGAGIAALTGENTFDVCLVDWNMPDMTGLEMLQQLNKMSLPKIPKYMMVTSESDFAHMQAAIAAGASEYLIKPFTLESIRIKLELLGFFLEPAGQSVPGGAR